MYKRWNGLRRHGTGRRPSSTTFICPSTLVADFGLPPGQSRTFPLDQVTEQLYDVREVDHYAGESTVIFLIKAASENKPAEQIYTKPDGSQGNFRKNMAEHRFYIVVFGRDGEHKKTIETDVSVEIQHIGVFPSGFPRLRI
jgi:hypothetical protein